MTLWIKLSLRNVLRNYRRSLLTALTVLFATALLTVALVWLQGIFGGMAREYAAASGHIRVVSQAYADREQLMPLHENLPSSAALVSALEGAEGVLAAEPRITMGMAVTAGEEIGDHFALVVGATERYYRERLRLPDKLVAGTSLSGGEQEVVLGRRLANDVGAEVGAKVLLLGQTQYGSMAPLSAKVVGVVSGDAMLDRQAFILLQEAQWLADIPEGAVEVLVYARSFATDTLEPVLRQLSTLPATDGLQVTGWHQREPWATMNGMIGAMQVFIELLILFLAALAIFNTMTMSVLERTAEIGVMRAMGLTRVGALGLFLVEAGAIGLVGGLAGTALGGLAGLYLQVYGITLGQGVVDKMGAGFPMRATVYGQVTPGLLVTGVLFGLLISLLGAALPALRASSIQPVSAMRARR